jgi:hypothetical protein
LSPEELQSLESLKACAQANRPIAAETKEQEAITHATTHLFERQSVVPEHELWAAALAYRPGEVDLQRLKQHLERVPGLVPTEGGFSTPRILKRNCH